MTPLAVDERALVFTDAIRRLGRRIDRAWAKLNHSAEAFHSISSELLADSGITREFGANDAIAAVLAADELSQQADVGRAFSDAPVTVYWGRHFYIEVLFWVNSSTSIHQHGFAGAFGVLEGSSVHTRYAFHQRKKVNDHFLLGDVIWLDSELLTKGDVRTILPGAGLIHSLFHLDSPSVSLVARTPGFPGIPPQYAYFPPCVAVNPFEGELIAAKRMQILDALVVANSSSLLELAPRAVESLGYNATFELLRRVRLREDREGLFSSLLDVAHRHWGSDVDQWQRALDNEHRVVAIASKRGQLKDPDHRFLAALLLNVPDGREILRLVEAKSGREPRGQAIAWLAQMTAAASLGVRMDEANEILIGRLLGGAQPKEVAAAIVGEFALEEGVSVGELAAHCEALLHAPILRPLFAQKPKQEDTLRHDRPGR